jgi:predicted DNA-binding ribbon-helix-helix protein
MLRGLRLDRYAFRLGRFTSLRLEHELFRALRWLAIQRNISMAELLRQIDATPRSPSISFTSAGRVHIVTALMAYDDGGHCIGPRSSTVSSRAI